MAKFSQRHIFFGYKPRASVLPGPVGIPGVNPRSSLQLPPVRIRPILLLSLVFALLSSLMLSSVSHKVGVYTQLCVSVWLGLRGNASHPVPVSMNRT